MTRRKARKLHEEARAAWIRGVQWESYEVSAPGGHSPLRIAFNAGMEFEKERKAAMDAARKEGGWPSARPPSNELPLDVWIRVYAEYMRSS